MSQDIVVNNSMIHWQLVECQFRDRVEEAQSVPLLFRGTVGIPKVVPP